MSRNRWKLAAVCTATVTAAVLSGWHGGTAVAASAADSNPTSGRATFYGPAGIGGTCSYPAPPADGMTVAAPPSVFRDGAGCGTYWDLTGTNGTTIRVKVDNLCPECEPGHFDLVNDAFLKLDSFSAGITKLTRIQQAVNPALPGKLTVRVKEGSSAYWIAVLIDNHGNGLTSVDIAGTGGRTVAMKQMPYGYWLADGGAGAGPFTITVKDTQGHTATLENIRLAPTTTQTTGVAMY